MSRMLAPRGMKMGVVRGSVFTRNAERNVSRGEGGEGCIEAGSWELDVGDLALLPSFELPASVPLRVLRVNHQSSVHSVIAKGWNDEF
jgi:hypothetical protein